MYIFFFNDFVTKLVACASNDRITVILINLVLVAAAFLLVFVPDGGSRRPAAEPSECFTSSGLSFLSPQIPLQSARLFIYNQIFFFFLPPSDTVVAASAPL